MRKLIFFAALIISSASFGQNIWTPSLGESAKNFSLKTVDGEKLSLNELLKSKPVVLVVLRGWPGYQCPICTKEVGTLISSATEFEKHHVSIFMVYPGPSKELTEHAKEFKQDFQFPENYYFTVDPDYSMINLYGLRWNAEKETSYPSTFVINRDGKIVYSKISHSHGDRSNTDEIIDALSKL
ncbi:MAG: peroxiredoxin family protein [Prolixibacteraceae bacterium]|nr:peroxiredoxin family protein [Prolixibacteraceae bacterium]